MIESAKIRTENARVVVDAVVDGVEREGWVVYGGQGVEFESAALQYLTGAGCAFGEIDIVD